MIHTIQGQEFTPMYIELLRFIANEGELEGKTRDYLGIQLVLHDPRRSLLFHYKNWEWCFQELFDRMSGLFAIPDKYQNPGIAYRYRPSWQKKLEIEDGTFDYAYGDIFHKQLPHLLAQLKKQKTTREAIISVWNPHYLIHQERYNRRPCTLTMHFIIRNNKLHLFVNMRTNDVVNLLPYDVFHHTFIQRYVALALGKELGSYNHFATHMYYPKRRDQRNYVEKVTEEMEKHFTEHGHYVPSPLFQESINKDLLNAMHLLYFHEKGEIKSPLIQNMVNIIKGDIVTGELRHLLRRNKK